MIIRPEKIDDYPSIRRINNVAFSGDTESAIIDNIRDACGEVLSLVAVEGDHIIGHIFFSPAQAHTNGKTIKGMGLGPMAVLPERQNQGIGSRLVEAGIKILSDRHYPFIIVLGHEKYYPRFGFKPASQYGLQPQWGEIPNEAFMVLFLDSSIAKHMSGTVFYRKEFDQAM